VGEERFVHRFFEGNAIGTAPIGGPILIIAGEADQTVPIDGMRAVAKQMCTSSEVATFRSYPNLDHDPVMEHSTPDQLAWIKSRFAGKPATSNCAKDSTTASAKHAG
jgi:pimeloyl-ACP methyl ester carboxylesterase